MLSLIPFPVKRLHYSLNLMKILLFVSSRRFFVILRIPLMITSFTVSVSLIMIPLLLKVTPVVIWLLAAPIFAGRFLKCPITRRFPMVSNVFNRTGRLKPRRNVFDLSYRKNFTCDMGQLIPIMADEVVPGDFLKIGNETVIRFQPLVAPIMHEITCTVHYFFVPYRILWDKWEDFISQGQLAGDVELPIPLPRMTVSSSIVRQGSLWDFFGLPLFEDNPSFGPNPLITPIDMPWRAYNRIYNEYYRDQDLQLEVHDGSNPNVSTPINNAILNRNWKKDYFTAARPFLQKGQAPALPVNVDLFWQNQNIFPNNRIRLGAHPANTSQAQPFLKGFQLQTGAGTIPSTMNVTPPPGLAQSTLYDMAIETDDIGSRILSGLSANSTTFNVSDLRLAFQTQKWLERNARAGTRYTEFLQSHFGVSPSDARLDRPEYIGGTKMPVIVNEVLQTSQSSETSPQGNMGGHGLAADGQYVGTYNVQEYGIIMGLLSVMPKPSYQQGINRQWLRRLPTDFYFPEFAHLSEQAIQQAEIKYSFGQVDDSRTFGYTGQYDEMRVKHDMVCSEMRKLSSDPAADGNLSYWNLSRYFPDDDVYLNSQFITCVPRKDVFALFDDSFEKNVPGLLVNVQNLIRATRPLPLIAEPGLVDHF